MHNSYIYSYQGFDAFPIIPISALQKVNFHYISQALQSILANHIESSSRLKGAKKRSSRALSLSDKNNNWLRDCKAIGVVLNTYKNKKEGQMLHLVVRLGSYTFNNSILIFLNLKI